MTDEAVDFKLLVGPDLPAKSYKAGDTIFSEHDPAAELYVIQSWTGKNPARKYAPCHSQCE